MGALNSEGGSGRAEGGWCCPRGVWRESGKLTRMEGELCTGVGRGVRIGVVRVEIQAED